MADAAAAVNWIRALPARGIRVWGARTLSRQAEWRYVNVRRLFLGARRWLERYMADVVHEPNTPLLWARIRREIDGELFKLFNQGVLKGASPQEAYFLRCDGESTTATDRENGRVVVELGLAPLAPGEFIVLRVVAAGGLVRVADSGATGSAL
jgi:phage tail sheath protein FI